MLWSAVYPAAVFSFLLVVKMVYIGVFQTVAILSYFQIVRSSPDYINFDPPELSVVSTATNCSNNNEFVIDLVFNKEFHGVVYAKHYPANKKCFSSGSRTSRLRLTLDTTLCGIRLAPINETTLSYVVSLVIQSDRLLQQKSNFNVNVMCAMPITDADNAIGLKKKSRAGRKSNTGKEVFRSWMEICNTIEGRVAVGDMISVTVKSLLPSYLSMRVVNCSAHDGVLERTELLTDYNGCPFDEQIVPALERIGMPQTDYNSESKPSVDQTILQIYSTRFSAFKFPDAAFLHIMCHIEVCQKHCPKTSCRKPRALAQGDIISRVEVHNSIEVLAPGIDAERFTRLEAGTTSSDEKKICLSSPKIAFAFSILGGIFLFAVLTTFCSLMRSRRRKLAAYVQEDSLYRNYSRLGTETDRKWLCT